MKSGSGEMSVRGNKRSCLATTYRPRPFASCLGTGASAAPRAPRWPGFFPGAPASGELRWTYDRQPRPDQAGVPAPSLARVSSFCASRGLDGGATTFSLWNSRPLRHAPLASCVRLGSLSSAPVAANPRGRRSCADSSLSSRSQALLHYRRSGTTAQGPPSITCHPAQDGRHGLDSAAPNEAQKKFFPPVLHGTAAVTFAQRGYRVTSRSEAIAVNALAGGASGAAVWVGFMEPAAARPPPSPQRLGACSSQCSHCRSHVHTASRGTPGPPSVHILCIGTWRWPCCERLGGGRMLYFLSVRPTAFWRTSTRVWLPGVRRPTVTHKFSALANPHSGPCGGLAVSTPTHPPAGVPGPVPA